MAPLSQPMQSPTALAIYATYERGRRSRHSRRLGASDLGRPCKRAQWYKFRWCAVAHFTGRMLRLFETGHREESRVIDNLRAIGCTVKDKDPKTQKQWFFDALGGHLASYLDGVLRKLPEAPNRWHLLEVKTHNTLSFETLRLKGMKEAKPEHWVQMQCYMGLAKLDHGLYVAVQKETDELHIERIAFDPAGFKRIIQDARQVIESPAPLGKVSDDPDFSACRSCEAKAICHGKKVPPVSCRTCVFAIPSLDGKGGTWVCDRTKKNLSYQDQQRACEHHLIIPELIPYATPDQTGPGWVSYTMRDRNQIFINSTPTAFPTADGPHFTSREIVAVPPEAIGEQGIENVRKILGGTIACGSSYETINKAQ